MTSLHQTLHHAIDEDAASLALLDTPDLTARAHAARTRVVATRAGTSALGVAAVAAVGLGVAGLLPGTADPAAQPAAQPDAPLGPYTGTYAFVLGYYVTEVPEDAMVVEVYTDASCPFCGLFHQTYSDEFAQSDDTAVVWNVVSYLDAASGDSAYSTRAANAIQEVAVGAPSQLDEFLDALWAHQPAEGTTVTDAELAAWASEALVPDHVISTFPELRYADDIAAFSDAQLEAGITYTPYIVIDGDEFVGESERVDGELWPGLRARIASAQE